MKAPLLGICAHETVEQDHWDFLVREFDLTEGSRKAPDEHIPVGHADDGVDIQSPRPVKRLVFPPLLVTTRRPAF